MSKLVGSVRFAGLFLILIWAGGSIVSGQTFTTLHSFNRNDGAIPRGELVQAQGGKLYGTTSGGGVNSGQGTIFSTTVAGSFSSLHTFHGSDGAFPVTGVVQGTDGNFYGTTENGGYGFGTIFKIPPNGEVTTIYLFCAHLPCSDGSHPVGGLVQGVDGNFYGTTQEGGTNGSGTVFVITPAGSFTTLHRFNGDGGSPLGALVQAADGNFYGTTQLGGDAGGRGTVFKITPSGILTTLHDFAGGNDGSDPFAGLVIGVDGSFYGTTYLGGLSITGCGSGCGTVFKITRGGQLTTLYKFDKITGRSPKAALILASDGNLYGTTFAGGASDEGVAFRITSAGGFSVIHDFCLEAGCSDGSEPLSALTQDTNGIFFGTTSQGGLDGQNDGSIFSLDLDLKPFVSPRPAFGRVGASIDILGTNLTGATSVSFNGVSAVFSVKSQSEIIATVPTDATSGRISVVTSHGKLLSNAKFAIIF